MKERLVKLLKSPHKAEQLRKMGVSIGNYEDDCVESMVADFLLANGVIVPPCKVGDNVYEHETVIWMDECDNCEYFRVGGFGDPHECARTKSPFKHPDCTEIKEVVATQRDIYLWLAYGEFGKTVFLTKAEAEKALAERREE